MAEAKSDTAVGILLLFEERVHPTASSHKCLLRNAGIDRRGGLGTRPTCKAHSPRGQHAHPRSGWLPGLGSDLSEGVQVCGGLRAHANHLVTLPWHTKQCCSQAEGEDELPKVKVRRTYSLPSSLMDQSCHRVASSGPSLETA